MEEHKIKYTPDVFARLPREELRYMLAEELKKDTATIDDTFVRQLMNELISRGADPAFVDDDAVEAACEKFRADTKASSKPRMRWFQSWAVAAASLLLVLGGLFFGLPAAVQAEPVPDVLSWWSESVFQFFTPGKQPHIQEFVYSTDHTGLQEIYDTVTELGITTPVVPRWIPEDFVLAELKIDPMAEDTNMNIVLLDNDKWILLNIITHTDEVHFDFEKDTAGVKSFELAGVEHYLLSNNEKLTVTWISMNTACSLATNCPEEDVYRIVKSIYTPED